MCVCVCVYIYVGEYERYDFWLDLRDTIHMQDLLSLEQRNLITLQPDVWEVKTTTPGS